MAIDTKLEKVILYELTVTEALPAGKVYEPTAGAGGGELDKPYEVGALEYLEIIPPVSATGEPEGPINIIPVLDDRAIEEYVVICGGKVPLMFPQKQRVWAKETFRFGDALSPELLKNTALKFKSTLTFKIRAIGATTGAFTIRAWGYKFLVKDLAAIFPTGIGERNVFVDTYKNRTLTIPKPKVVPTLDNWDTLAGGPKQEKPIVMPFLRWARNAQPTVPNVPYPFKRAEKFVAEDWENLYFDFDIKDALIIKGIGVRAHTNLSKTQLNIGGKIHPQKGFTTKEFDNPLHFGWAYPFLPPELPIYYRIPKLEPYPYLIWNEKGWLEIVDNGTSIPAGAVIVALNGIRIEF